MFDESLMIVMVMSMVVEFMMAGAIVLLTVISIVGIA
jgi:hypothetical protein